MSTPRGTRAALARVLARALPKATAWADTHDRRNLARTGGALSPDQPGAIPTAWAAARIVSAGIVLPALGAVVGATAIRHTRTVKALAERFPVLVDAACRDQVIDYRTTRVERAPARGRYF